MQSGFAQIHPGEFLAETLEELGVSQAAFSRTIGVSTMRVSHIMRGTRPVTADMALRFGKALGQTPEYWLNLQAAYDLKSAANSIGGAVERIERIYPL